MGMARLQVKVVPGASRDRIVGMLGDALKVQVSAAPERGRANDSVIQLLASALSVKPAQISIVAGHTQPRKALEIQGLEQEVMRQRLAEFL
jgi:uncharacterized protein (TIGR00251 family)